MATNGNVVTYSAWWEFIAEEGHPFDATKVLLLTESYTPSYSTHSILSDVTPYEVSGNGYERHDNTTPTSNMSGNVWRYGFDPATFEATTGDWTAYYYCIVDWTYPTDYNLICYGLLDVMGDPTVCSMGNTLTITWDSTDKALGLSAF